MWISPSSNANFTIEHLYAFDIDRIRTLKADRVTLAGCSSLLVDPLCTRLLCIVMELLTAGSSSKFLARTEGIE